VRRWTLPLTANIMIRTYRPTAQSGGHADKESEHELHRMLAATAVPLWTCVQTWRCLMLFLRGTYEAHM